MYAKLYSRSRLQFALQKHDNFIHPQSTLPYGGRLLVQASSLWVFYHDLDPLVCRFPSPPSSLLWGLDALSYPLSLILLHLSFPNSSLLHSQFAALPSWEYIYPPYHKTFETTFALTRNYVDKQPFDLSSAIRRGNHLSRWLLRVEQTGTHNHSNRHTISLSSTILRQSSFTHTHHLLKNP